MKKFFKKNYISEAGGSGYTAAFTHPDPLDPNDIKRQKTQSRSADYPYDKPISYGSPVGTAMDGSAFQQQPDQTPPKPKNKKPSDVIPYGQFGKAWEQLESLLGTYSPGEQADDAASMGYGSHGRMGEDGISPEELDMDALRSDFRLAFIDTLPHVSSLGSKGLFSLLNELDPEYTAELFAPDEDDEMEKLYADWGSRVYAPGAEDDLT